jgi:hypothetical protein
MRTLIATAAVAASLAFAGTSAMAATANVHKNTSAHVVHAHSAVHRVVHAPPAVHHVAHAAVRRAAPRRYVYGPYGYGFDVGRFVQSMFGGAWPAMNVRLAHGAGRTHGYAAEPPSYYSPSYDSPPVITSSPAEDTAAAIQQMNNTNAMLQSMQAAQQQNDEANAEVNAGLAAALQTEINANN